MLQIARAPSVAGCLRATCVAMVVGAAVGAACAQAPVSALPAEVLSRVQALAVAGAQAGAPAGSRVEVQLGQLDPRLRLAPCAQIQPYLPPGHRAWGRTRIGLRCTDGATRWNVSLPVTIQVFAKALVSREALPAGTELTAAQLRLADVDIAAEGGAVFTDAAQLAGRVLQSPLDAGEALRSHDLRARRWFAAGDRVQVLAAGAGFAITGEGQALEPGLEGRDVRVRFENGRTVTGRAVGERRVEVLL